MFYNAGAHSFMAHCKSWHPLQSYKNTGKNTFWALWRIIANMNSLNSIVTFKHVFPGPLKGFPNEGYYDYFKVILWMPLWFPLYQQPEFFKILKLLLLLLFLHPRGIVEEQFVPLSASSCCFYCYYLCKCIGLLIKKKHVNTYILTLYCVCVCVCVCTHI